MQLNSTSFLASLLWTIGLSTLLGFSFCFLRPRTSSIYAPRAKHADEKHAPPYIDNGLFSWVKPIKDVKESELVEKIGLDAVVFLRFLRMLRNIFLILTAIGLGIILPINMSGVHIGQQSSSSKFRRQVGSSDSNDAALDGVSYTKITGFIKMTPQF